MSPEQAKGRTVDRCTDIFAFGSVLYEMLTGRRAFGGEDVADTLASVLRAEPDFDALPSETPGSVLRVLQLCLTKDRKQRARDIGDVRLAMEGAFETPVFEPTAPSGSIRRMFATGGIAGLLVGALLAGVTAWMAVTRRHPRSVCPW